ncbi:urate oxidase [Streptomyces sp. NA04227]|nr:urate oxidase [Streptomyces sp. NA04227]
MNEPNGAERPRPVLLGQNQYGKAECRVVRVTREGGRHRLKDLNVSVSLSGDMDEVHLSGANARVLPTDTMKNTVFAFAKEYGIAGVEEFAVRLARHFVRSQEAIGRAEVRIEQYAWERLADGDGREFAHSFARKGQETRLTRVTCEGERWEVVSGLKDLVLMNTTDSEFRGFATDPYTTLTETGDRVLATEVFARWRFHWTGGGDPVPDWESSYPAVRSCLLEAFAGTYSHSLQQTLYAMGSQVIAVRPEVDEIRLSLPNKHHFLVDLAPFGLDNESGDDRVYLAADRPYGLIEATVLREGREARIPTVPAGQPQA